MRGPEGRARDGDRDTPGELLDLLEPRPPPDVHPDTEDLVEERSAAHRDLAQPPVMLLRQTSPDLSLQSLLSLLLPRPSEGKAAGEHGVEDDPAGPDVHLLGEVPRGQDDLGRGVLRGPAVSPEKLVGREEVAESEVSEDDVVSGLVDEDVVQLDVPVNNLPGVDVLNTIEDLFEQFLTLVFFQLSSLLLADVVAQTSPRPEVQHKTVEVLEGADLVQGDDVGMVQLDHDLGLPLEILLDVGILDLVHPNDLDGNFLPGNQMSGELHLAEGTFTETGAQELVVSNLRQLTSLLGILKGKFSKANLRM